MTALDEVREFLRKEGYELEEGHISGKSSGAMVRAEHLKEAMSNYELWWVIVHKIGDTNARSVGRIVERPTRTGLHFQWGDDSSA